MTSVVTKNSSNVVIEEVQYGYDALNNRIEKSVYPDGAGSTPATIEKFAYDLNGNAWADLDNSGSLVTRRLYEDAVDSLFARIDSGGVDWYGRDIRGSITDIFDDTGSLLNHIDYSGYGQVTAQTNSSHSDRYLYTSREYEAEIELQYNRARYLDLRTGAWITEDPIGFSAGDSNLQRYVENSFPNATDPSGLAGLPGRNRGNWISGTPGNGVFEYSDTPLNRQWNLVGERVRFQNGHIAVGGFPADWYYGRSATSATVNIDIVRGTDTDFTAADEVMRTKLGNADWERPEGYTWNHAGEPGSTTMELVDRERHKRVSHTGSASVPRREDRARRAAARATVPRGFAALEVYLTLKDGLQATGVIQPDYIEYNAPYYFTEGNSVYIVQDVGYWSSSYKKVMLTGPMKGRSISISPAEAARHQSEGDRIWGKYIPGTLFREPTFIPGTKRQKLPYVEFDFFGRIRKQGYIDKKGIHIYPPTDSRNKMI